MKTFVPAGDFWGYPRGKKTLFKKGVETEPLPDDFVDLMEIKGHVEGKPHERKPKTAKKATPDQAAAAEQDQSAQPA